MAGCRSGIAPVSGGGLLSGVAAAVKQSRPQTKVFGVEPELAGDTAESFRTGKIVTWGAELTSRTIADGLRTQSVGVRNFAHIQAFVDGVITVTEAEIRAAMRAIVSATRLVPEPSGAVPVAALLFHAAELPPYRKAAAVVSGGNVDPGYAGPGAHGKRISRRSNMILAVMKSSIFAIAPASRALAFVLLCAALPALLPTRNRSW